MSLWLVYISVLLVTTAEGVINTLLPPYLDKAHYSVELIGIVIALFGLLQLASRLPAGALYTGARAKHLLVSFLILYVLSTAPFGFSAEVWLIIPITLVHGFAFGAITTFMLPVAIQLQARDASHGARMGWYTAALSAGYALGAFVSGASADRFGYANTFIALGCLPVISIALVLGLPANATESSVSSTPKSEGGGKQIAAMFSAATPLLWFATLVAFYINFLDDGFGTFFPLFGLGIGLTLTTIGNLNGIKSAVGIIIRIFSGRFFRFVNYRLLNHTLVVGWSFVVFALPWVKEQWVFVTLFIFMGLARSLSRVTSATIVAEEKARDPQGIGMASGIYNMGLDVGALVAPLVAGFIARLTDIPTMMRIISVLMVVIYFGALVWLNRVSKPKVAQKIMGAVRSGRGEAKGFTQLDWVQTQFIAKLGFEPYPGTLNVETKDGAASHALRVARPILIEPAPNFCAARCYRVKLNGNVDAVWIVPAVAHYSPTQVELMAPVSLRDTLHLNDGDIVTVTMEGKE